MFTNLQLAMNDLTFQDEPSHSRSHSNEPSSSSPQNSQFIIKLNEISTKQDTIIQTNSFLEEILMQQNTIIDHLRKSNELLADLIKK